MVYVILGQTASGKTGLACQLGKELNLPLIGADAFQVYKELNIGSAKPTKEELAGLDYHLIGCLSVNEEFNVKIFQKKCRELLDYYSNKNQDVILSGGTFLYVKAALYPYEFKEEKEEADDLDSLCKEELLRLLKEADEETYKVIDKDNLRRVIRAIRMARNGLKRSEVVSIPKKLLYPAKFFFIKTDVEQGNARINSRVEKMISEGLVAEVKNLTASFGTSLPAFQAIGYKEVISGLAEKKDISAISEDIKIDTRQYAKRQRTFLRHQFPSILELAKEDIYSYVKYDCLRRKRNKISLSGRTLSGVEKAQVALIGLGGVGSIVASGLVRLGVSSLSLIDKDLVDVTNLNRQILYTKDDIGQKKAEACKTHLLALDPHVDIQVISDFFKEEYLPLDTDFIFDCIDDVPAKARIIKFALTHHIPFISATGSGLRTDSTKFKCGDLSMTGEPLAKALKKELVKIGVGDFTLVPICYSTQTPSKRLSAEIGSCFTSPNGEGLGLLSFFLSSFEND